MTHLERQAVLNAVNALARFVPRDAVAVLAKSGPGELILRAFTDDSSGAETLVAGTTWSGEEVVLPLDALRQVLRFSGADEVTIRKATDAVKITAGGAAHTLAERSAEHDSRAPTIEGASVSFSRGVLATLVGRVAFARGRGSRATGWAVDCIRVTAGADGLELTATDTYVYARAAAPAACARALEALLPFPLVSRWGSACFNSDRATLGLGDGRAVLVADGVTAWGPVGSGKFPPVATSDLPPHRVPVPPELRAALALVGSDDVEVTLAINPTSVTLTTPALTTEVTIPRHRGPAATIALEGTRLARAAKTLAGTGQPVALHYASATQPVVLVAGECRCVQVPHLLRAQVRAAGRSVA